jgi:hypothetical protein
MSTKIHHVSKPIERLEITVEKRTPIVPCPYQHPRRASPQTHQIALFEIHVAFGIHKKP